VRIEQGKKCAAALGGALPDLCSVAGEKGEATSRSAEKRERGVFRAKKKVAVRVQEKREGLFEREGRLPAKGREADPYRRRERREKRFLL